MGASLTSPSELLGRRPVDLHQKHGTSASLWSTEPVSYTTHLRGRQPPSQGKAQQSGEVNFARPTFYP